MGKGTFVMSRSSLAVLLVYLVVEFKTGVYVVDICMAADYHSQASYHGVGTSSFSYYGIFSIFLVFIPSCNLP